MRKTVTRALAALTVAVALAVSILAGTAHAATPRTPPTRQMVATCEAYRTWYYHRTPANIDAMMAATFGGTWTGTGPGRILRYAGRLYADVKEGAALVYVNDQIVNLGGACNVYVLPFLR